MKITRKQSLLVALLACAVALLGAIAPARAADRKPNVILMLADNLGYGDVGAYNGGIRGIPTPRLDQLAGEGLRLTQFLVEPGCTPSRAAMVTGRYSVRVGLSLIIAPGGKIGGPCASFEDAGSRADDHHA